MVMWVRAWRRFLSGTVVLGLTGMLPGYAWDDVDGPAAGEPESIGRYAAGCMIGAKYFDMQCVVG